MSYQKLLLGLAIMTAATVTQGARASVLNSVSVFATSPTGATNPDSVTLGGGSLFVSYAGSTNARTGAGFSTIVQYSLAGAVQKTFSIAGSVDGLKYDPVSSLVFALQNQDANSTLSLINPTAGTVSGPLSFAAPPYVYGATSARGYDDVAFRNGAVLLSYTNPASASDPVVQQLNNGNAPSGTLTTTDLLTAGQTGAPTPDTDSLKTKPIARAATTKRSSSSAPSTASRRSTARSAARSRTATARFWPMTATASTSPMTSP